MARAKAPGGVVTRHSRSCRTRTNTSARCNCTPTYEAWIYDRRESHKQSLAAGRQIVVKRRKSFPGDALAARTWVADATKALRTGILRPVSRETLEQAGEAWLAGAKAKEIHARGGKPFKPSVLRGYETALRLRVFPEIGDERFAEITLPDMQRFVNRLIGDGANPSTIRNTINPLRAMYRHALSEGRVVVNPCLGLQLPAVEGQRDRIASPIEADTLLAALSDADRAIWATAFYAGLRRGELRALRANDVDVKAGIITVERGWDDVEGEVDPKSKKGTRRVPIPAVLVKELARHLLATGRSGDDLIFGRTPVDPFVPNTVRRNAERAWAAAAVGAFLRREQLAVEIAPIGLHECRHTYVSVMYAAGVSLEEIGDYVGHAGTYMTDRYRHLLPDSHDEARRKLDSLLAAARV